MRHATEEDLDNLEGLLEGLRAIPQLRERRRGAFSNGGRAFLHFHEEDGVFYVDARLDERFERFKVSTPKEQEAFLDRVRRSLDNGHLDRREAKK